MNRAVKIIVIFVFSYLTTLLLCVDVNLGEASFTSGNILIQINQILNSFDIIQIIMGIIIYCFYWQMFFNGERYTKKNAIISIISVFLSIFIVVGKNLQITNTFPDISNFVMLFETLVLFLGAYFAFYSILKKVLFLSMFDNGQNEIVKKNKKVKKENEKKDNKFILFKKISKTVISFANNHPFLFSFLLIILCRLPYIILFYPGGTNGDTLDQLCQFFHRDASWSKDMVNLVNDNIYINQHHPVFSTLLLGSIVKIGGMIYSYGFGVFLYTLFQTLLSSFIFSITIYYMKKISIPFWIRSLSLAIICFLPHVSSYIILAVKDTPSALFTLLYVLFLIQIVKNYESIYDRCNRLIYFTFTIILVLLFRNNGIITICLSYPFLFLLYKKHFKKLLIVFLIPVIFYFSFNEVMYRCFSFSKGSPKEVLSIPFMQIARVVNKKGEDAISKKDQQIINKVLPYKELGERYDANLSDAVKDAYHLNATKTDLLDFSKVWFKYLIKYPGVYVGSFINSTYQYFYPYESYENLMLGNDERMSIEFPEIKYIESFAGIKYNIGYLFKILFKLPIIGILFKVSFYDWFLLLSTFYVIYKKNYKYLIPLMALLSVLLVCLASPINGSMRYILPILFSFPAILMIDYLVYEEGK